MTDTDHTGDGPHVIEREKRLWLEARRDQLISKSPERPIKYAWVRDFGYGITVSCGRGKLFKVETTDFKKRYVTFKFSQDGSPDAHALFYEWSYPFYPVDNDEFVFAADIESEGDYLMASMVGQGWGLADDHPLEFGSIVVLDRLVVPRPMRFFWLTMIAAIRREFSRRGALMVLKAFPLEWEGRFGDPRAPDRKAFERRLAAMTRHYERQLRARPLGDDGGDGTWFWIPINFREYPNADVEDEDELAFEEEDFSAQ